MALSSSGDEGAIVAEAQALRRTLSPAKRKAVLQQTRSWKSPVTADQAACKTSSSDEEIARLVREYRHSLSAAGRTAAQQVQRGRQASLSNPSSSLPQERRAMASWPSRGQTSPSKERAQESQTKSLRQDSSEDDIPTTHSQPPLSVSHLGLSLESCCWFIVRQVGLPRPQWMTNQGVFICAKLYTSSCLPY